MKSLYDRMGGTYSEIDGLLFPNLALPARKSPLGIWADRHLRWLRENRREVCLALWLDGKLTDYLTQINEQAEAMLSRLVEQMARREGVTEELKAKNQMEWVGRMNSIRNQAEEIVMAELICQ